MKGAHIVPMPTSIQAFVRDLDQLVLKNFPSDEIGMLFKEHPFYRSLIEPYIFLSEKRYTRNLIHKTPDYELLLLCWMPQQKSPIHGHEGEKCWMRVEEGELYFTDYYLKEMGSEVIIEPNYSVVGKPGFIDGPAVIHRVENLTSVPAVSLHLYARPFAQCDIFDKENRVKERIDLKYDSVHGMLTGLREL